MKIGVFAVLFSQRPFEEALDYITAAGCEAVEIGVGDIPDRRTRMPRRCSRTMRRGSDSRMRSPPAGWRSARSPATATRSIRGARSPRRTIATSAMPCGSPQKLGVPTVITFSGCPGGSGGHGAELGHLPLAAGLHRVLEWQWNERARPYWTEAAAFAKDHGVRVAIELHPGFVAYHTESFWRLREIGGETIGVNFDPSHLFWQGMDPLVCVRELGDAIFHVHMKDTWLDAPNIARNGVLDTKQYTDENNRSWNFRTVGYGHGQEFWRALISELRLAGYDGALSIEQKTR